MDSRRLAAESPDRYPARSEPAKTGFSVCHHGYSRMKAPDTPQTPPQFDTGALRFERVRQISKPSVNLHNPAGCAQPKFSFDW